MNRIYELTLKGLKRYVYPQIGHPVTLPPLVYTDNMEECNTLIKNAIEGNEPFMVARLGSTEMNAVANYVGVRDNPHSALKYIKGEINEWWWNITSITQMQTNSGFFPITEENIVKYSKLMLEDVQQIDILGSWVPQEYYIKNELSKALKYRLGNIEPPFMDTFSPYSWTRALKGKRVLVVHPFRDTIVNQYEKRSKLFQDSEFLPDFELLTVKAVQSLGGTTEFKDWFEALNWMKQKMDALDYDVAILGCGAYGLPLAAHAKRTGHKAIHLGGASQLLFGIRGNRWDSQPKYQGLFNDYWVRPGDAEKPASAANVENACYW